MFEEIRDPEVKKLAALSQMTQQEYTTSEVDPWLDSPFGWIKSRPSRQIGAIGEKLVTALCESQQFKVKRSPDSEADRIIEGHRMEIKFSTLWANGGYKFQQVRDQNYSHLFALGVSPFDAHAWIIPKEALLKHVIGHTGQHTGAGGADTAWIGFDARNELPWMRPYGGSLSAALVRLRQLGRGPH